MQEHEAFFDIESFMDEFYKSEKSFLDFYKASGAYKKEITSHKSSKNQEAPRKKISPVKNLDLLSKSTIKVLSESLGIQSAPIKQLTLFDGLGISQSSGSFLKKSATSEETATIERSAAIKQAENSFLSPIEGSKAYQLSIFDAMAL